MIRLSSSMAMTLLDLIDRDPVNRANIAVANVRDSIEQQLQAPHHDADLIDTVQRIIGDRGRVRNVLTDAKLDELRQAFFSPRDLSKLSAKIDQMLCAGCGHPLADEHIISVVGGQVFCNLCLTPSYLACPKCRGSLGIYDSIRRLITKVSKECEQCAAINRVQARTPDTLQQADDVLGRTWRNFTATPQSRNLNPPPAPPPPSLSGIADILTGDGNDSE